MKIVHQAGEPFNKAQFCTRCGIEISFQDLDGIDWSEHDFLPPGFGDVAGLWPPGSYVEIETTSEQINHRVVELGESEGTLCDRE